MPRELKCPTENDKRAVQTFAKAIKYDFRFHTIYSVLADLAEFCQASAGGLLSFCRGKF